MTFKMHGAREIVTVSAGAIRIQRQIEVLEDSISENPGLAFDLSKALIETVCKTILKDRGIEFNNTDNLPRLIKETMGHLNIGDNPNANSRKGEESLKRIVSGLANIISGVCEIRNLEGFASHGKDAYHWSELDSSEVYLVARATDAIVNYLFKIHTNLIKDSTRRRIDYFDNTEFNDYIDTTHEPVAIFELSYSLSEILFKLDIEAYKEYLNNFISNAEEISN